MKILIVEDDDNKLRALQSVVASKFPDIPIEIARSLISGIDMTRKAHPDIILLDMTLPSYDQSSFDDGGGMEPFGGVEFLRQMKRFKLSPSVLIVTQFETFGEDSSLKTRDQLSDELKEQYPATYHGMLHYHASLDEWTSQLVNFIRERLPRTDGK